MDKELQCIEIAKLCGWEFKQCSDGTSEWHRPDGSVDLCGNIPRYAYDLNDMHRAEETLLAEQWNDYIQTLSIIASGLTGHMFFTYHATAAQRAEAFLRMHNKWKD